MSMDDVLIIGAGPAGLAAAIQLQRTGISPRLLEKDTPGGLLRNANLVENYLGFPGGIPGPELIARFQRQAAEIGVEVTRAQVQCMAYHDDMFWATTPQQTFRARIGVVASGTQPTPLPAAAAACPQAQERIFYEVWPLRDLEQKTIAIVGGGDLAFDYGLNLAKHNQVHILNRGRDPNCLPLLWERAAKVDNLRHYPQTEVAIIGLDGTRLSLDCTGPAEPGRITADYLLCAIGRQPQLDFVSPELSQAAPDLEQCGRLYWIGDVKNGIYRQAAIAAGDGILAAMKISRQLKGIEP